MGEQVTNKAGNGVRSITVALPKAPWWRLPICWMGMCGCVQQSDDTHIWAECVTCGKKVAPVSREAVRRYIQAEESDAKFIERMKAEGRI